MSDKLKAAEAMAKAVREYISRSGDPKEAHRKMAAISDALAAYEAAPAETETLAESIVRKVKDVFSENHMLIDYIVALESAEEPKPAESQAAGEELVDWQRAIASDFARWFENEGVGICFDECLAIVKQHAPPYQSQQIAAAQARIAELEASKNFYLDGCAKAEKISDAHINRAEKAEARVAVLEKALKGADNTLRTLYNLLATIQSDENYRARFEHCIPVSYEVHRNQIFEVRGAINAALAASSASGSKLSREKEGA